MKTTMKKTAAFLLAVLLVVQLLPATADQTVSGTQGPITSYREKLDIKAVTETLTVGMEIQLETTDKYEKLVWTSDDETIATVDKNGKVTAVGAGTVRITATEDGHSDSITLRVIGNDSDKPKESGKGKETEQAAQTGKMIILINGTKDKVTYDGQEHVTSYKATSNSESFDESKLHLINEEHLASGTDCNVYQDKLVPGDFTYDGEDVEIVITNGWLQIKPAQVTVTAVDKKKIEGDPDPEFTAKVTGLLPGDDPAQIVYTFRTETSNGTTRIIPECDSIQGNYRVSTVEGELVIMKEQPLYNFAIIGSTWYRLAKTKFWTDMALNSRTYGKVLTVGDYEAEGYDFSNLVITVGGKEYIHQCEKNAEAILSGANYYTTSFVKIEILKSKIGAMDGDTPRWLVPESQQYGDKNETDSFHRNYSITLHENTAAVTEQKAYTMLAVGDDYYRLRKTAIKARPAEKLGHGTVLKDGEYELTPYNFSNVKLNIDGTEYIYSANGQEDETVSYFTVEFVNVQKVNKINHSDAWFRDDKGWLDGAESEYGNEKNETPGYHANYKATLHKGVAKRIDKSKMKVTVSSDWPVDKPAYKGTVIKLTAHLTGFEGVEYHLQWQRSEDLQNWENIPGATGSTFTYELNDDTAKYTWRVVVADIK